MSRRQLFLGFVVAALPLTIVTAGPGALAATDHTPPTLKLPAYATFVVGSQLSDTPDEDSYAGSTMLQKVGWKATDSGSGICGYSVTVEYAGMEPDILYADTTQTSLTYTTTDYDDQFGGGSFKVEGFGVTAEDCAGNTTQKFVEARPVVTQEDGWTFGYPGVALTYSGTWTGSSCACWSADRARATSAKGAAVAITKNFPKGDTIALVMEKAPNRGAFTVYVDGVRKATVNTYSKTVRHRTVVWVYRMPGGVHTVTLVNKATKGHPRIDLDAVLTGTESVG